MVPGGHGPPGIHHFSSLVSCCGTPSAGKGGPPRFHNMTSESLKKRFWATSYAREATVAVVLVVRGGTHAWT